ncbi:Nonribosomal peptide synthetase 2 like protein [Verticillium longisporum]|uniref:Nonribosomal peptide synthetase 2 like protein n=1 Tax=Verticillium longisporum TaxID=100787 RepID=A0A8I2ZX99_VERLO|nr:Nonribosomal peptide synthetase 2 like protein [Verticillium longisporum]
MPLVVVPRDIILDDIAATIRRLRITHLDLTPSLARLLDPKDVPTLCRGVFITGGEALKQEILDTWGPQGVIYNAYGPTEATIGVTMYQRVPQNGRASNIGRQFDNVGTYVFEPGTEKPVLRGAVGELCISGKLVGKGYLNRPELTAERFPVLEHFKEKIYRTGDLVRVMYDGCFEFLGRADDQVKLRGQRLEIGEINHAIRTGVAAVKDVVTLVTKHPKVDKDLLVTFVTSSEAATSIGELEVLGGAETFKLRQTVLKACRHKLPGYMVPSYVLEVPFIPLSINNKAEMKILRHLFASLTPELLLHVSAPAPSQEALATTKTQKTVLRAVSKFSGVSASELSLTSNLFDLGIDSISCLRLSRLLKHDGLRTADPALVLKNPFLGDLAEALSDPYDHEFPSAVREAQQQIHAGFC